MSRLRNLLLARQRTVLAFLALAFIVRAMVPAGYMVGPAETRFLEIRVCSGADSAARQRIAVDFDGGVPSPVDRPPPESCVFAALAHAALLPASPPALALALAPTKTVSGLQPLQTALQPASSYFRPPPRAPPGGL
ncbi:MAG TPA: DUF2946 family protein [Sphingopyxis sp.]|nr:DUF2946 family protein [Sphingopyxis sp.]